MKKILFLSILAITLTTPVFAEGGYEHGGGYGHGGGHGGGNDGWWIIPALVGGVLIYELTQQPPPNVPPAPVYIEQSQPGYSTGNAQTSAPGDASSSAQYWYFCAAANGYYPYVRSCPGGWQPVPTIPPAALPSVPYAPPPPPR